MEGGNEQSVQSHVVGGDLLLALALGRARAESLSEATRTAIAIDTPVTRALRHAASVDGLAHLALVGPPGSGKSFAARMADRLGLASIELHSPAASGSEDVAREAVLALRARRRLLITARPDDLADWTERDDLDDDLHALLRAIRDQCGAREEWPIESGGGVGVLDLSYAAVARAAVLQEMLRRASSLALGDPRDVARETASVALRDRNLCAWVCACALDAERRMGPLTIKDLWRFVAALACGARPARGRGPFDLADSVPGRLLRHEYMSQRLRAEAEALNTVDEALAERVGFTGLIADLRCSEPESLAAQSAMVTHPPPGLAYPSASHRGAPKRASEPDLGGTQALPEVLRDALSQAIVLRAGPSDLGATLGRPLKFVTDAECGAVSPNPLMRRSMDGDWVPALRLHLDGRAMILLPRDVEALTALAAKADQRAFAAHPLVAPWREQTADQTVESNHLSIAESPESVSMKNPDRTGTLEHLAIPAEEGEDLPSGRPLSLLNALGTRGLLDASVVEGGAFRVSSPADLAATTTLRGPIEHVARWTTNERVLLGEVLRAFTEARAALIRACDPSPAASAWRASLTLERGSLPMVSHEAVRHYLSSYVALLSAAAAAGGDAIDHALMLDVAFSDEPRRRARLLPLHPLMVARSTSAEKAGARLPPVIAIQSLRTIALYAEGEPGFYHGAPERWPPIEAQRGALRQALRAWLREAPERARVEVDLIDARFVAPLVCEVTRCVADHARSIPARRASAQVRPLASSTMEADFTAVPSAALPAQADVAVAIDPSVRLVSEAREGAFVFAVIPAPHAGRRASAPEEGSPEMNAYVSALAAARIDARPPRLESGPPPSSRWTAAVCWSGAPIIEGEAAEGWRVTLLDGSWASAFEERPAALSPAETHPGDSPVAPPRSAPSAASPGPLPSPVHAEPRAALEAPLDRADSTSSPTRRGPLSSDAEPEGAAPSSSGAAKGLRWPREELRAHVASSLGRRAPDDDVALVAEIIRDTVSSRRAPLRHVVHREVARCIGPICEGDATELVERTIEDLVDLGDLVARRSSEHGPYLIELASSAVVSLRDSSRALILGRAEATLSEDVRAGVTCIGSLRMVDLAKAPGAREELRFHGAVEIPWQDWARAPAHPSPDEALNAQRDLHRFSADLSEYDVFDPVTPRRYYRGRIRRGELDRVLARDRWAVASRESSFDRRDWRIFHRTESGVMSASVEHARFVELAAACAARAGERHRFLASEGAGVVRVYFPPPRWLARLLALGQPAEPDGALIARRIPDDLRGDVLDALRRGLWCEVVSS